jgi:hypothetical protein
MKIGIEELKKKGEIEESEEKRPNNTANFWT